MGLFKIIAVAIIAILVPVIAWATLPITVEMVSKSRVSMPSVATWLLIGLNLLCTVLQIKYQKQALQAGRISQLLMGFNIGGTIGGAVLVAVMVVSLNLPELSDLSDFLDPIGFFALMVTVGIGFVQGGVVGWVITVLWKLITRRKTIQRLGCDAHNP